MSKLPLEQFKQLLEYDVVKNHTCIEVEFCVDDVAEYDSCWLGKTIEELTNKTVYWYGCCGQAFL